MKAISEKGRIIVQESKKGFFGQIEIAGKKMPIPSFYEFKDDSLNSKECVVEREQGQIKKITVDGNELPRKDKKGQFTPSKGDIQAKKDYRQQDQRPSDQHSTNQDGWSINNTRLPKNTRDALKGLDIDNFSLNLNKSAQFIGDKFVFFKTDRRGNITLNVKPDYSKIPFGDFSERERIRINNLNLAGFEKKELKNIKTDWRLVVGLGGGSVYETSMALHHIYGIPYIPGSAVKGVTRSWIIAEVFNNSEEDALNNPSFIKIFGNQKHKGKVIFTDAFPIQAPEIKPDVMNPHFGDYYSGKKDKNNNLIPPADYLNTGPIFFLTVENTSFNFYLIAKNKDKSVFNIEIGDFTIMKWLKKALLEHGIGAKTAVGYGYFNDGS